MALPSWWWCLPFLMIFSLWHCGHSIAFSFALPLFSHTSNSLTSALFCKVFGDRGYVSQPLASQLFENFGIEFLALPKRNMKNRLMRLTDKLLSRKRSIIETVIDQLKNISQIEHSRYRSPINAMNNVICGLIYFHQPKKPALLMDWTLPAFA